MWWSALFTDVSVVECDGDRVMAVRLALGARNVLIFCVWIVMTTFSCLAQINAIIESLNIESVLVFWLVG